MAACDRGVKLGGMFGALVGLVSGLAVFGGNAEVIIGLLGGVVAGIFAGLLSGMVCGAIVSRKEALTGLVLWPDLDSDGESVRFCRRKE